MNMSAVAVIPARGGSKAIPNKNLRRVGGRTLIARAVEACASARGVSEVVVTSDSEQILNEAATCGAICVRRPAELSDDAASSESALLHAVDHLNLDSRFSSMVFAQCTSPFLDVANLDIAIELVESGRADSVFSAVENWDFLWRQTEDGALSINHDGHVRKRRQDLDPQYRETGSFYVFDLPGFLRARYRFFGRTDLVVVERLGAIDIDDYVDLEVAEALAARLVDRSTRGAVLAGATAIVWDFDGVHTDDSAILNEFGAEAVKVSRSDGMGIRLLRLAGVPMLILSSETNPVVERRASKLGVPVIAGTDSKVKHLTHWANQEGIPLASVVYVGNDVNDLECMKVVGFPVAVAGSPPEVSSAARYCTVQPGGSGAVREVADMFLAANPARND